MDRFIAETRPRPAKQARRFKIQYGQIYSRADQLDLLELIYLKSNMDRFIAVG